MRVVVPEPLHTSERQALVLQSLQGIRELEMSSSHAFKGIAIGLLLSIPLWMAIAYAYFNILSRDNTVQVIRPHNQATDQVGKIAIKPDDGKDMKSSTAMQP